MKHFIPNFEVTGSCPFKVTISTPYTYLCKHFIIVFLNYHIKDQLLTEFNKNFLIFDLII